MATTITRSLATNFGGSINEHKLVNEITENATITTTCNWVGVDYPDTVKINFASTPGASELTELDSVVISAHDSTRPLNNEGTDNVGVGDNANYYISSTSTTYEEKKRYIYNTRKRLSKIVLALWVDSGTTGSARVVNCNNDMVVAERTDITATTETAYDMGTLLNLPSMGNQRLRIELKVDVGTICMSALANDYEY
jgi:hypothetical protein